MEPFETSIEIAAPPERVWEVMFDVDRWHEWTRSILSIRRLDEGPLTVGSRVTIRQPGFPPARWKVTAVEEGRSFIWESRGPGLRVVGTHAVAPLGTGSRATLRLAYTGWFGKLLGRATRRITERYIGYEAQGLRARSEDPGYAKPSPGS